MRRRLLCSLYLLLSILFTTAQSYHNEWIDYSKTYYKFNLGPFGYDIVNAPIKNGSVRITQQVLAAAGLGNTPAQYLQLWRNGQEVPLYVSNGSGVMSSSDYIEFWGEINDGVLDRDLYKSDTLQLSDYWSLQTDTAAFFLTVNTTGTNKQFITVDNNPNSSNLQPDASFMYTVGRYYRAVVNGGYYALVSGRQIYSCAYDKGEGFTSRGVTPVSSIPQGFYPLYADMNGGTATVQLNSTGNAPYRRQVKLLLNSDSITQFGIDYFDESRITIPDISVSRLSNDSARFIIQDLCDSTDDALRVASITLTYPRLFNFANASTFQFTLAPSATGRLISITNFNAGTSMPVLYDIANGKRYVADISIAKTYRFLLLPSTVPYKLAMVRGDGSTATFIPTVQQKTFTDYFKSTNQGNYLIISNPLIYGSGSTNYVEQYRTYRASPDGGSFNAKVIDIEDLTDQFAYGIKRHPLSVKNFLRFARNNFAITPSFVFLIGKGVVYSSYNKDNNTKAYADQLNLVPTWGNPGSDNFLASENTINPVPLIPIGRLSAVSALEVGDYLDKVKHYEALQKQTPSLPLEARNYMKRVIQIAGANDPSIGPLLANYTHSYTAIISDTAFGATVNNYIESEDPDGYPLALINFKSVYESGSSLVEYFGHSSTTSLDFNLDNPGAYNTNGRYPVFIVNGCQAGNMFDYDASRFNLRTSITEKFVLEPRKGAIGYVSTSSFGIVDYLNVYTQKLYQAISHQDYGKSFGIITANALNNGLHEAGEGDYLARYHAEEYTYHGDPAITLNSFTKPDYAIDTSLVSTQPTFISTANDSFKVKINIYNLGKAVKDSVHLSVYRKFPNGDSIKILGKLIAPLKGLDSLILSLPVVPNRDTATEYIAAFINDDLKIDELNKINNYTSIPINIYQNEIRPVYPYDYSIINTPEVTLTASTANSLAAKQTYLMEMDTTALFNSPMKKTGSITSIGGIIEFKNMQLTQPAVYYWRVSQENTGHWNLFSFTYNPQGAHGFEQSHYFQHTESSFSHISLDSSRTFRFDSAFVNVFVQQGIFPYSATEPIQQSIMVNGHTNSASACIGHSIIFNTFDSITFKPHPNLTNPFGAAPSCGDFQKNNFEYYTTNATNRNKAFQFLDSLPKGTWVIAKRNYDNGDADWASVWAKDSLTYTSRTLYQSFKNLGLPIDSFNKPSTFVFIFRKDDTMSFKPLAYFSQGLYDRITFSVNLPVKDTVGSITSPMFGPAEAWNSIEWNGFSAGNNDFRNVTVYGIDTTGVETLLYTLDSSQHQFDLSHINASIYPYARLRMETQDSLLANPYQLHHWLVTYQPVAEGAIAPNLGMQLPDTLLFNHGMDMFYDTLGGYVVFKNVSNYNFKPLKFSLTLTDENDKVFTFSLPKTKALVAGDTLHASFNVDVRALPRGLYNLHLTINPDSDQPEQYLFNNSLYKYVYISRDNVLPMKLTRFTAIKQNNTVTINWSVINENNIATYEVEHSSDGIHFTTISAVNATRINAYNSSHNNPVAGSNYYRLKIVDANGIFTYSNIAVVQLISMLTVGPNPFYSYIKVTTGEPSSVMCSITVYSALGQQLLRKAFNSKISINTAPFAAGTYIIKVERSGCVIQTFKLQKHYR
jgi:hypothetical protein